MGTPEHFDWLAAFPEAGQTFDEYLNSDPTLPTDSRKTIYVLPIVTVTKRQERVIETTAKFLEAFYGLPVSKMPSREIPRPLSLKNRRVIVSTGREQVRTGFLLEGILKPILPSDAAALIAFTAEDLYPDGTMSFVFGQANMEERVGLWSLYRLDEDARYENFLRRTLKIAAHETGHMFSMHHCTKYECVMSGTNHLEETDRRPIDACPECMAKVCLLTKGSALARYERLIAFCRRFGLSNEQAEFEQKWTAIRNP
jgi:archaemetzincin